MYVGDEYSYSMDRYGLSIYVGRIDVQDQRDKHLVCVVGSPSIDQKGLGFFKRICFTGASSFGVRSRHFSHTMTSYDECVVTNPCLTQVRGAFLVSMSLILCFGDI